MVQGMDQTGLVLGQQAGSLFDGLQHGPQDVHHFHVQFYGFLGHRFPHFRRNDGVADNGILFLGFGKDLVDLFHTLHIGNSDDIEFFLDKLAGGGFHHRFRSFSDGI